MEGVCVGSAPGAGCDAPGLGGVGVGTETLDRWEGRVAIEGRLVGEAEGPIDATMADNLSSFLSKSRALLGAELSLFWPSVLDFAGRLRATCSIHSTRAF